MLARARDRGEKWAFFETGEGAHRVGGLSIVSQNQGGCRIQVRNGGDGVEQDM